MLALGIDIGGSGIKGAAIDLEKGELVSEKVRIPTPKPATAEAVIKTVGKIIKELKYKNFRFYFVTNGYKLKCYNENDLVDLLIRFVRMSDKKTQQKVIDEIKVVLKKIGPFGF